MPNSRALLAIVTLNGIVYLLVGLPLAVLPEIVHIQLGYSAALAGTIISLPYAVTLAARPLVGRFSDRHGPKFVVSVAMALAFVSGLCLAIARLCHSPAAALAWLALSRLWLGAAVSGTSTGCITWGMGRAGAQHTARVIAWNGVASYGGIALGAPLGAALFGLLGLAGLAGAMLVLTALGQAICRLTSKAPVLTGQRAGLASVARRILPYGLGLAGGSIGFGAIMAFIALDYDAHHWPGAAWALCCFGAAFIVARVSGTPCIGRFGGFWSALVSLTLEAAGLLMLWAAPAPALMLVGAALSGFGFSLVFPAIAVEALKIIPPASRGSAIAMYNVFLDLSLGLTGPVAGLLARPFGYPSVFLAGAGTATAALLITWQLKMHHQRIGI